jgi:hypothetical protein
MLFTRSRSRSQRIRDAARIPDRQGLGRLLRRGRSRAEHIAEDLGERLPEMTEEVLSDLSDRLESWQKEAAPLVESVVERVPKRRRRSRKKTALRLLVGIAFAVTVAVIAYLIWQRRDTEPAYLVEEPDEPLATPDEPPADEDTPDAGPGANPHGDGRAEEEAVGRESFRVEPERETAGTRSSGWIPANRTEDRGYSVSLETPRMLSFTAQDQLPKLPSRPTFLR